MSMYGRTNVGHCQFVRNFFRDYIESSKGVKVLSRYPKNQYKGHFLKFNLQKSKTDFNDNFSKSYILYETIVS